MTDPNRGPLLLQAPAVPSHVKIPDIFENFVHPYPALPPKPNTSGMGWWQAQKAMNEYWSEVVYHGPHMYRIDGMANPRLGFGLVFFLIYGVPAIVSRGGFVHACPAARNSSRPVHRCRLSTGPGSRCELHPVQVQERRLIGCPTPVLSCSPVDHKTHPPFCSPQPAPGPPFPLPFAAFPRTRNVSRLSHVRL